MQPYFDRTSIEWRELKTNSWQEYWSD